MVPTAIELLICGRFQIVSNILQKAPSSDMEKT